MSTPFNPYWLEPRVAIPVDIETTAALLHELRHLKYLIEKTYYINEAGCTCQRLMDNSLADVARDVLERYQALNETPPCKTHPDAPHGFDRNASHSADRYVCECEGWEPVDNVDMSEKRVHKLDKSIHEPVAWADKVGAVIPHSHKLFQPALLKDYTRPLYTAPYTKNDIKAGVLHKEWVGLTDEEFEKILETHNEAMPFAIYLSIEAKLKEKNT